MDGPTPKPGKRKCLKCGKTFLSRDLVTNRICTPCNRANAKERDTGPAVSSFIYVNGRRVPFGED